MHLHERICGHCGSRAFRLPVGSEKPALACRYCGKVIMLDAFDGEAGHAVGRAAEDVGASPRAIRLQRDAVTGIPGSRRAIPLGGR